MRIWIHNTVCKFFPFSDAPFPKVQILYINESILAPSLQLIVLCRDKSKKKAQGAEEQNKPGIEALGRVDSRLNGCVAWDKKKRGGYPFTIHLLIFFYYLHSYSYSSRGNTLS
jgi:hypothetical protein